MKKKRKKKYKTRNRKRAENSSQTRMRLARIFPLENLSCQETAMIHGHIFAIVTIRRDADRVLWTQQAV